MAMMISKVQIHQLLFVVLFLQYVCSPFAYGDDNSSMVMRCIERERQTLLMFKKGVVDNSGSLSSWISEGNITDCCKWQGVECSDVTGHVTSLYIEYLKHISVNMTSSLIELKSLNQLHLEYNDFGNMPIPSFISSLTNLVSLSLSYSNLSGPIPYRLKNLSNLESLDLSGNNFASNPIPEFISTFNKLERLRLSFSNFRGAIPYQLGNLSKLKFLDLSGNNKGLYLTEGNVKWMSRLSSLTYLDLSGVDFSRVNGWIDLVKALPFLSDLRLAGCSLSGVMVPSLSSANSSSSVSESFVTSNYLKNLYLNDNLLTGPLPGFRECPSLEGLDLSYNQFSAFLPETFGHVPNLDYLDISRNLLEVVITKKHLSNLSRVRHLDLSFNNLSFSLGSQDVSHLGVSSLLLRSCKLGPRFPNWIKTLEFVVELDLSSNGISESIPTWFWNNRMKYLNLSSNEIRGTLPDVNLTRIHAIDLRSNNLEGPIPNFIANATSLYLSRNNFSGTLAFLQGPTQKTLDYLDVSHNSLSGEIPDCWMDFNMMLILNFAHNKLSGKLPVSLGSLMQLEVLDLHMNRLSGELPVLLKNFTRLSFLNLGQNKFSGYIPQWMGEISKLYILIMRSNEFLGSIPLQLCQLRSLQLLDLSANKLSGNIPGCFNDFTGMMIRRLETQSKLVEHGYDPYYMPSPYYDNAPVVWKGTEREYGRNLEYVRSIDLSSNKLKGELPNTIFTLLELVALNLSNNDLGGCIPSDIGDLKWLQALDLSKNSISGRIPTSMSNINFLSYLDLSSNNLSGRIPTGTQLQSFNASMYEDNFALCGLPLVQKCPDDGSSQVPSPSNGNEETNESDRWFYVSAALGFSIAFWGVCGVLFHNRRWRHAYFLYLDKLKDWIYVSVKVFVAKSRKS